MFELSFTTPFLNDGFVNRFTYKNQEEIFEHFLYIIIHHDTRTYEINLCIHFHDLFFENYNTYFNFPDNIDKKIKNNLRNFILTNTMFLQYINETIVFLKDFKKFTENKITFKKILSYDLRKKYSFVKFQLDDVINYVVEFDNLGKFKHIHFSKVHSGDKYFVFNDLVLDFKYDISEIQEIADRKFKLRRLFQRTS